MKKFIYTNMSMVSCKKVVSYKPKTDYLLLSFNEKEIGLLKQFVIFQPISIKKRYHIEMDSSKQLVAN